ncbi:MAG: hypothetical protein ABIJ50_15420 [Pseudomonadota bacterium]
MDGTVKVVGKIDVFLDKGPLVCHGKINHLMPLFQQEIPFLKKYGFRTAVEVEEPNLLAKRIFIKIWLYIVNYR